MTIAFSKTILLLLFILSLTVCQDNSNGEKKESTTFNSVDMKKLLDSLGMTEADLKEMQQQIEAQNNNNKNSQENTKTGTSTS